METEETALTPNAPVRVTLLTKSACGFCDEAKAILARLALVYSLTIEVGDFASPQGEQLALRGGVLFPPGVFLNGEAFSYGRVSERKLRRELERRAALLSLQAPRSASPRSGDEYLAPKEV
jgi:hypothetical protein